MPGKKARCQLCLQEANLVNSHIIPRSFNKMIQIGQASNLK